MQFAGCFAVICQYAIACKPASAWRHFLLKLFCDTYLTHIYEIWESKIIHYWGNRHEAFGIG